MKQSDLEAAISAQAGISQREAKAALGAITGTVAQALGRGDEVAIAGLGKFAVSDRAARQGRNPKTGEPVEIAARKAPVFRPAKALKDALA